jgi:lysophospholipase L1-like esterase
MKNRMLISFGVIILLVGYLFLAHHLIYAKIGKTALKASDITHEYNLGQGESLTYEVIGDSLTAGVGVDKYEESYPYLLAQKMISANNVFLRVQAYPGARTSDVIKDLLAPAINDNPDIVTVLLGVNDIHGFISKKKFAENYQEILTQLKTKTKAKIYVISIPYIGADALLWPPYNFYFKHQTIEYNKIIKKLAQADNIEYVDLFTPTENMYKDPASYSADLFHPSAKGYGIWADAIYAHLNK